MTKPVNSLFYGDNLHVLREHVKDESVDLVYLDPPFKSNQDYNVLFADRSGERSVSQIRAFEDTWHWDLGAEEAYRATVEAGGRPADAMRAMRAYLGESDMMAYLAMMTPRLIELRRVMTPSGSIYLHCDPTASHYLKLLMDGVFGPEHFLSEITWKRTHAHGNAGKRFADVCDRLLFYSKGPKHCWNQPHTAFDEEYVEQRFTGRDADGRRWQSVTLRNPGPRPNLHYPYRATNGETYQPHPNGWSCDLVRMQQYDREQRLHFPAKPGGQLRLKMYLDESPGVKVSNLWDDIFPINSQAQERLGYPTQKPEALLDRIVSTSSNQGEVVLDPFCGCGTAVAVAQQLKRRWIGIDITHLAVNLVKHRLRDSTGAEPGRDYRVIGEPTDESGAAALAQEDRFQFQWWALGLVGARPAEPQRKKGADHGIDGRLYFHDDRDGAPTKQILFSVKSGGVSVKDVRDLRAVVEREKAQIGVLITMQSPTKPMRTEAAAGGFYSGWGRQYARLQIFTVGELLQGATISCPPLRSTNVTLRKAPTRRVAEKPEPYLFDEPGTAG